MSRLRFVLGSATILLLGIGSATGHAQEAASAHSLERGQTVVTMGQPHRLHYFIAGDVGLKPIDAREFVGRASLGIERTFLNPMVPVFGATGEYFFGISGQGEGEVGLRLGLESPVFHLGGGAQYEFRDDEMRGFASLRHPLRRGGVFWPGGQLRVLWFPGENQALTVGVTVPLGQPFAGRTRPRETKVTVPSPGRRIEPVFTALAPESRAALDRLTLLAARVRHCTIPYIDQDARTRRGALDKFARGMHELAAELDTVRQESAAAGRPAAPAPEAAVRAYHACLVDAFRPAARAGLSAELLARVARGALLDEVLLPYDRFLGQKKDDDAFVVLAARARVEFARRVVLEAGATLADAQPAEAVFAAVLDLVGKNAAAAQAEWGDDRLVWLPLQFGLLPEDHDSQAEIDALLARAVEEPLTDGNQVWYVVSEQFQYELLRMINATRQYHVLWIHDIRGFDDGNEPDAVAYRIVLDGYLNALAERLENYDREGILPVYMIFIDEWYYEARKGRLWLDLLENPLGYKMDLPKEFEAWEKEIGAAQDRLRRAVANSGLLQAEIREYGTAWLHNRVRVQVNVTNPVDGTFWTWETLPWVGMRDDFIRDHRKISFYDVNPTDPQQGMALYTGMGVGEHYTGATWDDRAIRVKGPVLLSLRRQARELLLQQGFKPDQIPFPLRDEPPAPADASVAPAARAAERNQAKLDPQSDVPGARMLEMHNFVGYGPKRASLSKAMLYSLMPPGAVVKAPDSIWNQPLWAALLLGHALRGGRVMAIAPTFAAAPARSGVSLSRAEEVLGRLVVAESLLAEPIRQAGGLLKVGLYNPDSAVGDIPARIRQVVRVHHENPWLASLHGLRPAVLDRIAALADSLAAAGFQARYLDGQPLDVPRLHMKTQYFASAVGWDSLVSRPAFGDYLLEYLRQRAVQVAERGQDRELTRVSVALRPSLQRLFTAYAPCVPPADREHALWYLLVGSHNQNYRSMSLDGEVLVAVAGPDAVVGLADFVIVLGMTSWIDTPAELDHLLPPASGFKRKMSRWLEVGS